MHEHRTLHREGGFTLIEMMMVLLVLGILMSLALVSFFFSTRASKETACRANLRILRDAVGRYQVDNGLFPANLSDLIPQHLDGDQGTACPVSNLPYEYDPETGEVGCPSHPDF